jgi:hypothetical protein
MTELAGNFRLLNSGAPIDSPLQEGVTGQENGAVLSGSVEDGGL